MSEYGSIIGGAVGAVVGYFAGGNVYAGWMIGSAIGGAWSASKQVIPGPKIGEAQKQWVTEGAPIPIVYGYSPPMQGTVAADMDEPLIVRTEESGKGGPKQETESAYRTYAIVFCEGETELRQAWKNGRLVYNADDAGMAADNAAFLEYATWMPGGFDQMPHPALEELYGAGNAPAFRGRSVLVLDKEDVTDGRGMRSQWHVRVFRGAAKSYTTPPYPIYFQEGLSPSAAPGRGYFYASPQDNMRAAAAPLDGVLESVVGRYEMDHESVEATAVPLDGSLDTVILDYALDLETLAATAAPLDGTASVVLLRHSVGPENLSPTAIPLNGTLETV